MVVSHNEAPSNFKKSPPTFRKWYRNIYMEDEEDSEITVKSLKHNCRDCTHWEETYELRCRIVSFLCVNSNSRPYFKPKNLFTGSSV